MMQKVQEETINITADTQVSESIDQDIAVPKWPKYDSPSHQKQEISQELKEVQEEANKWKTMYDKSSKSEQENNTQGLTEFQKKQREIDLQHNITVSKIKADIFIDRQQFLEKLIKVDEEVVDKVAKSQDKELTM